MFPLDFHSTTLKKPRKAGGRLFGAQIEGNDDNDITRDNR
jgi:hypothetical protein